MHVAVDVVIFVELIVHVIAVVKTDKDSVLSTNEHDTRLNICLFSTKI